ncbi:dihydrofolate reductase family protein [Rhizobium sp. J15]|uniref:dihydrofolate reductase family protein n=1 Tax=Rhizobium sp. J15 TaxID=2035450 RepID=UPI001FE064DD|nr:dihydrofolate reductase family protein [Rhizobium sp. J15]
MRRPRRRLAARRFKNPRSNISHETVGFGHRDENTRRNHSVGNNIAVFDGAGFGSALIATGLVDEFQFYVNPAALGGGTRIFDQAGFRKLRLLGSKAYECGIVVNRYAPAA